MGGTIHSGIARKLNFYDYFGFLLKPKGMGEESSLTLSDTAANVARLLFHGAALFCPCGGAIVATVFTYEFVSTYSVILGAVKQEASWSESYISGRVVRLFLMMISPYALLMADVVMNVYNHGGLDAAVAGARKICDGLGSIKMDRIVEELSIG